MVVIFYNVGGMSCDTKKMYHITPRTLQCAEIKPPSTRNCEGRNNIYQPYEKDSHKKHVKECIGAVGGLWLRLFGPILVAQLYPNRGVAWRGVGPWI